LDASLLGSAVPAAEVDTGNGQRGLTGGDHLRLIQHCETAASSMRVELAIIKHDCAVVKARIKYYEEAIWDEVDLERASQIYFHAYKVQDPIQAELA